ncbi:hypothetical protein [Rhizobium sp. Leaf321]|nr:hypothetical protein [Rhizobium sp. Leaf321]
MMGQDIDDVNVKNDRDGARQLTHSVSFADFTDVAIAARGRIA